MTEYAETAALIAAMEGDEAEVERLVADMFPGERRYLLTAVRVLEKRVTQRCAECDGYIEELTDLVASDAQRHRTCVPGYAATKSAHVPTDGEL